MAKFIEIELRKIAKDLIDIMKQIIIEQKHSASGRLINSFNFRVNVGKEIIDLNIDNSTDYWEKIDSYGSYGRGVSVEVAVIIKWLVVKRLTGGMNANQIKKYAINIVRELAEEYPTKFGRGDMSRSNFVEKADLMAQKLGVYNSLDVALNNEMTEYLAFIKEEGVIDIFVA
tara:strand:- start:997 stop:1512 length:516 start_codon:yes stop_codon:yes gene_type:complete